jgi:hypothetical protein
VVSTLAEREGGEAERERERERERDMDRDRERRRRRRRRIEVKIEKVREKRTNGRGEGRGGEDIARQWISSGGGNRGRCSGREGRSSMAGGMVQM